MTYWTEALARLHTHKALAEYSERESTGKEHENPRPLWKGYLDCMGTIGVLPHYSRVKGNMKSNLGCISFMRSTPP